MIYEGEFLNGKRHGLGTSFNNNKIEYDGEWVKGIPKSKYILLFAVIPVIFGLCIVVLAFILPMPSFLQWLIMLAVIICGLIFLDYIWKNISEGIITKDFYPRVHSKRYKFEYESKHVMFGDECYSRVKTFKIDGLNRLKCLEIGKNSFTQEKNDWGIDKSRSFHILNCESLESIQIGEFSFSDFGGDFELKNLPQLQSIQIGTIGSYSCNFCCSSFVIRGIDMILNI